MNTFLSTELCESIFVFDKIDLRSVAHYSASVWLTSESSVVTKHTVDGLNDP